LPIYLMDINKRVKSLNKKSKLLLAIILPITILILCFCLPSLYVALLGLLLVTFSGLNWGIKGGLASFFFMIIAYSLYPLFSPYDYQLFNVVLIIIVYAFLGIGLGAAIDNFRLYQNQLKKNEEKFKTLFDKSINAIMIHDKDTGEIIDANEMALRTHKCNSVEELKRVSFITESPYSLHDAREMLRRAVNEGPQQFEWLTRLKTGEYIWEEVRLNPINIDGAERVMASCIDITESKQLENNQRLFLQLSAHELRNPMSSIKGVISLIRQRINRGRPVEEIESLLELQEKEIDRLSHVLNQVLEAFKEQSFQDHELNYNWERVNLAELVSSLTSAVQAGYSKHRIALNLNGCKHVWVKGDSARLEIVLSNLLNNAIKYTPEGKRIQVSLHKEDKRAIIAIRDEGVGIPEEHLAQIFDSFYRAVSTEEVPEKAKEGMGLGLYISKEIVNRHGGRLWARNNSDEGCTFYVELPIWDEGNPDDHQSSCSLDEEEFTYHA